MRKSTLDIRLPMGAPSVRRMMRDGIDAMVTLIAILLLLLPLCRFVFIPEWFRMLLFLIPVVQLLSGWFLPLACFVHLAEESVRLTCFGIQILSIPWNEVRVICGVGTESDQCLCLSRLTVEEMAKRREEKLRKGFFTKGDVVFLQRSSDWQTRFTRDYLNDCRSKAYVYLRDRNQIWIDFDPNVVLACRQRCAHAAYCNLLVRSPIPKSWECPDRIPTLQLQLHECSFRFCNDGILVIRDKQEEWTLKANEIRTVVRVHQFFWNSKYTRNHVIILVASTRSVSEMAAAERARLWGGRRDLMALLSDREELLVASFCLRETCRWTRKHRDLCPMYDTPENSAAMRKLCPGAQWIDPYSDILD